MTRRLRLITGLLMLLVLVSSSGLFWSFQKFVKSPINLDVPIEFDVAKGTGAFQVAKNLEQQNIVASLLFSKCFLLVNPEYQSIKSGRYQISPGMTIVDVFGLFMRGEQIEYQFTLVEGLTFKQVKEAVQSHPQLAQSTLSWDAEELLRDIQSQYFHPEGIFFADTYSFPYGYTDRQLYKRAYQRLIAVLNEEWEERAPNLPYQSPYEALIMASLIEKETALASERPKIAGVFVRRLEKKMRLQTDPSVIYGIGEEYQGDIKRIHLKTDSPYNTYTRKGLPPTPIAMIGREAINAALHPESGTALYFVAKGDGSHHFSDTLEQHNQAVRDYILKK